MALTYNLDFALFYACVLALFSWLAFFFIPIAARAIYVTVKEWIEPTAHQRESDERSLWFDAHRHR